MHGADEQHQPPTCYCPTAWMIQQPHAGSQHADESTTITEVTCSLESNLLKFDHLEPPKPTSPNPISVTFAVYYAVTHSMQRVPTVMFLCILQHIADSDAQAASTAVMKGHPDVKQAHRSLTAAKLVK